MSIDNKEDLIQLIGFHVGNKLFGADILNVREILREPDIEADDSAPEMVSGMVRLRGQNIPIVNLKERLGDVELSDQSGSVWVLIAQVGDMTIGFIADNVSRIIRIDPNSIMPAPDIVLSGLNSPYIQGMCESEMGMLVVLDFNRLFTSDETTELSKIDIH